MNHYYQYIDHILTICSERAPELSSKLEVPDSAEWSALTDFRMSHPLIGGLKERPTDRIA